MADANTYSDTGVVSILDRRKQLKRQRRSQFWRSAWRTGAIFGCVLSLGWLFSKPEWNIRKSDQVQIIGNTRLSDQTIATFLPLSFPTSILRVKPGDIKTTLENHTHVNQVLVSRQLFPPQVLVQVQERQPVAFTTCRRCILVTESLSSQPITLGPSDLWLLDQQGIPLPYESYLPVSQSNQSAPASKVPDLTVSSYLKVLTSEQVKKLKIKDLPPQSTVMELDPNLQRRWQKLFPVLSQSPMKIQELNLQDPNNLRIKTELGNVRLGPLSSQISKQLTALDQMRTLSQRTDLKTIKSIDLENPERPVIEYNQSTQPPKPQKSP